MDQESKQAAALLSIEEIQNGILCGDPVRQFQVNQILNCTLGFYFFIFLDNPSRFLKFKKFPIVMKSSYLLELTIGRNFKSLLLRDMFDS